MLPEDLLSLVLGREAGLLLEVEANCAHIGVSATPLADDGGVVFSLSFWTVADRSLLERFIFANMAERLVEDFDFLAMDAPSCDLVGTFVAATLPLFAAGALLDFDGDEGGDCTFPCLSPSTRDDFATCGWSGGRKGTDLVLETGSICTSSGVRTGRVLDETSDLSKFDFEEALRLWPGRCAGGDLIDSMVLLDWIRKDTV